MVFNFIKAKKGQSDLQKLNLDLQKFKLAADNTYDQIIITDPDGTVIYANPAIERVTGYKPEEAIGKKAGVLWGNNMPKEFYEKFWDTIKNKKIPFVGEITNTRKDGERYAAFISVSPVLDSTRNIIYFVAIERDITKEKEIDRMKTEFVSLASHQLRTPLTTIKWYVEMLLDGTAGKLTDNQKQYLNDVYESNEEMIKLVNTLLNISRIEQGRLTVKPKLVDLKSLYSNILGKLKPQIEKARLIVKNDMPNDLNKIKIDPVLISNVFSNILANSIKYTRAEGKIEIKIVKEKEYLITSVSDTGIGIPKAEQERIFERFFRASNVSSTVGGGNGLGLYLAKEIVESSSGKIWFESKEGKGSTFYFSLPLKGSTAKTGEVILSQ